MEAQGLMSMPGVGFFGMLIVGILAGWIAEKVMVVFTKEPCQ
jgi:fructose-specific phosphotransferase system IIC component